MTVLPASKDPMLPGRGGPVPRTARSAASATRCHLRFPRRPCSGGRCNGRRGHYHPTPSRSRPRRCRTRSPASTCSGAAQDRLGQDARVLHPAGRRAGRGPHHGMPPARPRAGADPGTGKPGPGGHPAPGPGDGTERRHSLRRHPAKPPGCRPAGHRTDSSSPARAGWPTLSSKATATSAMSRSACSTKRTTWLTWDSCPW